MYVWLLGIKSGFPFPRRSIAAFTILMLKLGSLREVKTGRNVGGVSDEPGRVVDMVMEGGGKLLGLDTVDPTGTVAGPSTTIQFQVIIRCSEIV